MTRVEIEKRIDAIEEEIFLEDMKDRGYDFTKVRLLNVEKRELEEMLKNF